MIAAYLKARADRQRLAQAQQALAADAAKRREALRMSGWYARRAAALKGLGR